MSDPKQDQPQDDVMIPFTVGTLHDRRVLIHFGLPGKPGRHVDHLKITPNQALELAEALVEAARSAAMGHIILAGRPQTPKRGRNG